MVQVDLKLDEYKEIRKRRGQDDLYRLCDLLDDAFGLQPRAPKKDAGKVSPLVKTGLDPNK